MKTFDLKLGPFVIPRSHPYTRQPVDLDSAVPTRTGTERQMAPNTRTYDIPLIYRAWFLYVDPILSIAGAYGCFFDPTVILSSYLPTTLPPQASVKAAAAIPNPDMVANPAHKFVWWQLGGFFVLTILLSVFLLRHSLARGDLLVWKLYLGGLGLVDVAMLAATYSVYADQGRLVPLGWRWEDWFSILVTAACAALRAAFVLDVGVVEAKRKRK